MENLKINCYKRSDVYSWHDLEDKWKKEYVDNENDFFVNQPFENDEPLPLSMFIRPESKSRYHGYWGLSYGDGYAIILSKCGTQAIVAHLICK